MKLLAILTLVFGATLSCGDGDKNPTGSSNSLAGSTWLGTFKAKSVTGVKKVKMQLNVDKSFAINLTDEISSVVKGSFTEMPRNKALIFDIAESGNDLLGLTGETYDFTYDLNDNEMNLEGSQGSYLLMREGSDTNGKEKPKPLEGDWKCSKAGGRVFFLNISDSFRGRKEESGQRTVFFEGAIDSTNILADKKMELLLTVKSSNFSGVVGNKLILRETGSKTASLIQCNANGKEIPDSALDCNM